MEKKIYKHYSFDLWGTLIKSNPEFKKVRAEYFAAHFNRGKLSLEEVQSIFHEVGEFADAISMTIEVPIDAFQMYVMVLQKLRYDMSLISQRDILTIYNMVETNFLRHHPTLFDENTERILKELKAQGATLSILSNTNYAKGISLRRVLQRLGIDTYFTFHLYSDEMGYAKPNHTVFGHLKTKVQNYRSFHPVDITEIVHIGDNEKADGAAKNAGIDSIIINSNNKRIKDLV